MPPALPTYEPREPSQTVLYQVVAEPGETFLASFDANPDTQGLPPMSKRSPHRQRRKAHPVPMTICSYVVPLLLPPTVRALPPGYDCGSGWMYGVTLSSSSQMLQGKENFG
jgi:hypothetical protein